MFDKVLGIFLFSFGIFYLIKGVLLKCKQVKIAKAWEHFLGGTGFLLWGLHNLYTHKYSSVVSLSDLGAIFIIVSIIFLIIEDISSSKELMKEKTRSFIGLFMCILILLYISYRILHRYFAGEPFAIGGVVDENSLGFIIPIAIAPFFIWRILTKPRKRKTKGSALENE